MRHKKKPLIYQEHTYFSVISPAYSEPQKCQESWNHKDTEERKIWSMSIWKEFKDIIKRGYGENSKGNICLQINT